MLGPPHAGTLNKASLRDSIATLAAIIRAMALGPARRDADKAGEGGNIDEGFDPLHAGQSASRCFVPKWLVGS